MSALPADCQSLAFLALLSRATVLTIAALAGVLCIFLGWKLYKDAVLSKTEGSVTLKQGTFKFAAAGPGVFFALFGMWLLIQLIERPTQIGSNSATRIAPGSYIAPSCPVQMRRAAPIFFIPQNIRPLQASTIKVGTTDKSIPSDAANSTPCLVQQGFSIVMFDGKGFSATPERTRKALDLAINSLAAIEEKTQDANPAVVADLRTAIVTLQVMRQNIVGQ